MSAGFIEVSVRLNPPAIRIGFGVFIFAEALLKRLDAAGPVSPLVVSPFLLLCPVSACATDDPCAKAAPIPTVIAPAPSQTPIPLARGPGPPLRTGTAAGPGRAVPRLFSTPGEIMA
ncbi:hypothetical protein CIW47_14135 [Mycolicibacterium sp. P1-5]|nr:hypothetical protein CIW47_14135 [Mycolicibacterium sp. P1-5]